MIKKLIALSLIIFGLIGCAFYGRKMLSSVETVKNLVFSSDTVTVHVFVHGTRLSGFSFLSAIPTLQHDLKDHHFYTQVVNSSRNDTRFYDSQIMLESGLVKISQEDLEKCRQCQLAPEKSRLAALQIISGYDVLVRKMGPGEHVYYAFGWDGLLSDTSREQESLELYNSLITVRDQLSEKFPEKTIKFILHGHSHGGNVILYLGLHENIYQKNLVIDKAVLYGTPIQVETACFCQHPMFKKIISLFSEGDKIQVADTFSTKSKCSKRTFASVLGQYPIKQENRVIELCVSAAGNKRAFSHAALFFIGLHGIGITQSVDRVFKMIKPLPVILFSPIFLGMLETFEACEGMLNFERRTPQDCRIVISSEKQSLSSDNLVSLAKPMQDVIEKTWKPYAVHGYMRLGGIAIADLFKAIPQYTRYKNIKYKARRTAKNK